MTFSTDEKLRSYLDTNQLIREQMCRAILATDTRYSNVTPRHPSGGPDGGRDLEATFAGVSRAFGAVAFVNGANDSKEQKKNIQRKFKSDVDRACLTAEATVFVFMTNLNLTVTEKQELVAHGIKRGFEHVEILDRERLRIALDQPQGFFIRFQYLGIPLSEAEQASFLAQYGQDIQAVVESGFERVDDALARVTFLLEARDQLGRLAIHFELDRIYSADEIRHFRAFAMVFLREVSADVWCFLFGSSDLSNRMRDPADAHFTEQKSGIRNGISFGQWERKVDVDALRAEEKVAEVVPPKLMEGDADELPSFGPLRCGGSAVGIEETDLISIVYRKESFLSPRFERGIALRDLHDADFMPMMNLSLASKVKTIHIIVDGYKLDEIDRNQFKIDKTPFPVDIDELFTDDERKDPWVRLRPQRGSSSFHFDFYAKTPRRLYTSPKAPNGSF